VSFIACRRSPDFVDKTVDEHGGYGQVIEEVKLCRLVNDLFSLKFFYVFRCKTLGENKEKFKK
jgi:hypothetical protein